MRLLRRVIVWVLGTLAGLIVLLLASIFVDMLLGGGRVAALTNVSIANPDGPAIRAYVARPDSAGPHPAVIMIHEWWGLREELHGKADALAAEGYLVVVPDVFRGGSTGWIPRALFQVISTPTTQVDADLDAVFTWLAADPQAQPERIAIMGFCFGGGTALRYSLHNEEIAATAVFYGSTIAEVERLRSLPGPVLGIFGAADQGIPVSEVQAFEAALEQAGVPHEITIYDDQPHAFVTSIEEIRRGGAQGQAWSQLLSFLRQVLQDGALATRAAPALPAATLHQPPFGLQRAIHVFICDLTLREQS